MAKKTNGGAKNGIYNVITLIIIAGVIFGWVKINNIHNVADVYGYFKAWADKTRECADSENGTTLNWKCDKNHSSQGGGSNNSNVPGGTPPKPEGPARKDADYTPPTGNNVNQNAPKREDNSNTLTQALNSIKIENAQNVPYKRSEWRHWIGKPCDTRETVLKTQGKNVKTDPKTCSVLSGEWVDLYHNNDKMTDDSKLDIDHVIPLGYAAKHGGQAWSSDKKQSFANDTTQLLAVSFAENRSKSDKGPAEYMPSDSFKCEYSKIWISTALKYGVSISSKDKDALQKGLSLCSQK